MNKICDPLKLAAEVAVAPRRKEFLEAVVGALQQRVQQP
jgi:hypothetical protein